MLKILAVFIMLGLSACTNTPTFAPVYEIADIEPIISHYSAPTVRSVTEEAAHPEVESAVTRWRWPVGTPYKHTFVLANKGIDIGGTRGEPVYAAAAGKVVYSGRGLRGYGKLVIIKHNNTYLSVYAHNQQVLIKQGDWVKQGQPIANMGDTGTNTIKLHFEIRRLGKPLNPLILGLPKPV